MIRKVTVTRAQWLFSGQCAPGGARVDTIDPSANRCQLATLPRCVAIAIAPESEVRGVRVGMPGVPFASLVNLIEGAPQLFRNDKARLIDLVKLDWTDGALVLECAETVDDIAGLSVYISDTAGLIVTGFDTTNGAFIAHLAMPRVRQYSGALMRGLGKRTGGIAGTIKVSHRYLEPGGLALNPLVRVSDPENFIIMTTDGVVGNGTAAVSYSGGRADPTIVSCATGTGIIDFAIRTLAN